MNLRVPPGLGLVLALMLTASASGVAPSMPTTALHLPTQRTNPATVTARPATPMRSTTLASTRPPVATPVRQASLQYVFPVRSQGKIRYGPDHHDYAAVDIFCPVGSEFLAVTDGVVDYVSREDRWNAAVNDGATRGGRSVAIIGDDGVRYYGSHLLEVAAGIAPGVRVTVGQVLGRTGHSGNARGTSPHLHFGISHPSTPDDWQVRRGELPPYNYLRAWQQGKNVMPTLVSP